MDADTEPDAPKSVIVAEGDTTSKPDLRFVHFNDVYHIEAGSREPVGGVARFQSLHSYYKSSAEFKDQVELLTFFSGDAFNPSLESTVTKGGHMVPFLNNLLISAACVGNHDLDFGIPQFQHLTHQCHFPWLFANVLEPSGSILGGCKPTHLLTASNGIKIGLIGLAEEEWLATVNALPPNLTFLSAAETANKYSADLRSQGADLVIALVHQREPNDLRLARDAQDLDLVLGGHDHEYRWQKLKGTHVLCSGTDFKQLSYLEARRRSSPGEDGSRWDFTITRRDVTSTIPPDAATQPLLDKLSAGLGAKLDKPVGYAAAALDARFVTVRRAESNLGNFVADVLRAYYGGDCAIIVGGTFRGDQVYPPGVLRLRDLMDCFPFEDPTVVVRASGKRVKDALENAVSLWPALEGRFPQVSGVEFAFDPGKKPRVQGVRVAGEMLDETREYRLVTRHYTTLGGDGFGMLKVKSEGEYVVDEENGQLVSQLLRQYFMSLRVMGRWKRWSEHLGHHWGEVHEGVCASRRVVEDGGEGKGDGGSGGGGVTKEDGVLGQRKGRERRRQQEKDKQGADHPGLSDSEDDEAHVPAVSPVSDRRERELDIMRRVTRKWWRLAGIKGHPGLCDAEELGVHWAKSIAPRVEGRIKILGQDTGR